MSDDMEQALTDAGEYAVADFVRNEVQLIVAETGVPYDRRKAFVGAYIDDAAATGNRRAIALLGALRR
jgi:hypothetical protein